MYNINYYLVLELILWVPIIRSNNRISVGSVTLNKNKFT